MSARLLAIEKKTATGFGAEAHGEEDSPRRYRDTEEI
jgi:hypothetical protein